MLCPMNWFRRLFTRIVPQPRQIAEIETTGELVELRGRVEALQVLRNPLDGSEAVMLNYSARMLSRVDQQVELYDESTTTRLAQGASFLLRDSSGVAMIEVDGGVDVEAAHAGLIERFGAGFDFNVAAIAPGEQVVVRGRVREVATGGSPHRRADWTAVIADVRVEHASNEERDERSAGRGEASGHDTA